MSERGQWARLLREAHKTYLAGDPESALLMYLQLGELGIEVAQSNAAYILEEGVSEWVYQEKGVVRWACTRLGCG